ncbi:hypothetical protein [Thermococcus sp. 21S7]|uniref:hypothetical protein n=1 Tax=Thermococcus sp. 21S7 TaxID=1638221 RepID=UPI00143AB558|nr:hypothetical protein [Thermococcus sp. 21S7]NJE60518.1 hypothetical protein [Thermococcus sp. 21S7]
MKVEPVNFGTLKMKMKSDGITAAVDKTDMQDYFVGVEKIYLTPKTVAAITTALLEKNINVLVIRGVPIRKTNTIEIDVWKIENIPGKCCSKPKILRLYPRAHREVQILFPIPEADRETIRVKLSKYIETGIEIPLTGE